MTVIGPGATIGILGGGQLGRMLAIAAARLGYRCHIFAPEAESPAGDVSAALTRAGYDDVDALRHFAAAVDVVTLEFENVPVAAIKQLAALKPVRPGARALQVTQDRLAEKDFARGLALDTAPYRAVENEAELKAALAALGTPAILKTRRLGYDGKGQVRIATADMAKAALREIGGTSNILEGVVAFDFELSIVAARGLDGSFCAFEAVRNRHEHGILRESRVPSAAARSTIEAAIDAAQHMAEALDYVGVFAVEFFVLKDGRIAVNEMAPRVHNSGHWTIDACRTDQFEQHIRAVCGLPLGPTDRHSDVVMENLLGEEIDAWRRLVAEPAAKLHLYGKSEARPGRKMGHVTRLSPRT